MRILISNDDGIHAPGIHALANELAKEHEVFVFAPDQERSGASHSFTYLKPLRATKKDEFSFPAFAVSGTPVDCVKLGLFLMEETPDMIVTGINRGANLSTAILYSGTVSAAMEGALLNIPSIAVSLHGHHEPMNYEVAAQYAHDVVDYAMQHPMPMRTLLNVNVPDVPLGDIQGMQATKMGFTSYTSHYDCRQDTRGVDYFWLDDMQRNSQTVDDDLYWIAKNYVTITPVSYDMTNYDYLDEMKTHTIKHQ